MPPWALTLLVVAAFVTFWSFSAFLTAWMSGWLDLAEHYRAGTRLADGSNWHLLRSGRVGLVHYGNCLGLSASAEGLSLSIFPPLFPFHPPLFFPWSDVSVSVVPGLFWNRTEFRFALVPSVRLRVGPWLARALMADANRSWAEQGTGVE